MPATLTSEVFLVLTIETSEVLRLEYFIFKKRGAWCCRIETDPYIQNTK